LAKKLSNAIITGKTMLNYELYIALMKIRVMFDDYFIYESNKKKIIEEFKNLKDDCPDWAWKDLEEFYEEFKKIDGDAGNIESSLDKMINNLYKNKDWAQEK
jgi:hypothetical protein